VAAVRPAPAFAGSLLKTMKPSPQLPDAINAELLQACVSHHSSLDTIHRLAESADWDSVFALAERHCVIPLVYRALSGEGRNVAPRAVLNRFTRAYVANAAQSLRLTGELLRLLEILESDKIPVVPFKGPVLADLLFGNVSLRQFADLDILVRETDLLRAKRLLIADGYSPEFDLEGKAEQEHIRFEHALQFRRADAGFVIELHWRFGSRNQVFPVCARDAWTRLETRSFQGRPIRSFSREDLLLYLSVHGAKHGWGRLEWIVCIGELLRISASLDWDALRERAARSGALRTLNLALLLAGNYSPLQLPEAFEKRVSEDKPARQLARQIRERLFLPEPEHSCQQGFRHAFYLRARERWRDRTRIVFHSLVRVPHPYARDWELFRVPASLSFLYYLLRPIRLLSQLSFRRLRTMLRPRTAL
jgi:hypothetical protein